MFYIRLVFSILLLSVASFCLAAPASNIVVVGSTVDDEGDGNNVVLSSADGVSWVNVAVTKAVHFWDVSLANDKYLVAGQCRLNLQSPDGLNFSTYATPFCMQRIIWSHNQYFSLFNDPDTTSASLYTSPDGITFTKKLDAVDLAIWSVARGDGRYVAVGYNNVNADPKDFGRVFISKDGNDWQLIPNTRIRGQLYDIVHAAKQFVAVGTVILTSPDGITWTNRHINFPIRLASIGYNQRLFVAVGTNGMIITSRDGRRWKQEVSGVSTDLNKVAWVRANNQFVAVGAFGVILTSPNGFDWTKQVSNTTLPLTGVAGPHDFTEK